MKTTQELIPSLKPVYDRYKSGDIMKSAFGSEHGITSNKFWRRSTAAEEKKNGNNKKGSNHIEECIKQHFLKKNQKL